ncbi:hypothetical protein HF295_06420 [Hujiaoplasma nucleasis]|uniref:Uncharacterized protein n=1 Tax=Hujiaoplasma nucleasis TaxID=2725268 RepID=A0A7L6N7J0_9MOLU|nr:hypothetical protein [Hujiaoplasma nucleasis]QLY40504.1 hypothetical protein HF295_06420 [Hujiaoplasma nucleasis]
MDEKNKNDDKKTNEEIRKEIEQLEKLIEKVKEQNKEKKKQKRRPAILRINLAAIYSRNPYINIVISFLINVITVFLITKIIGHLFFDGSYNDLQIMLIILGLTLFEEVYKNYLFKKHMATVIYSVGTIFLLLDMFYFYIIDYIFFDFRWFIDAYHPILFVITFAFFRYIIKFLYKKTDNFINRLNRR